jgi:hypothetical protein
MAPRRDNPTETEKRLDRIEIAIAQQEARRRVGPGPMPYSGHTELEEVIEAARGHIEGQFERRPHRAPEQRAKAVA